MGSKSNNLLHSILCPKPFPKIPDEDTTGIKSERKRTKYAEYRN